MQQAHDCSQYGTRLENLERRMQGLDIWKEQINNKIDQLQRGIDANEKALNHTCSELKETKTEIVTELRANTNSIADLKLINAEEKGMKAQSERNLKTFIALVGISPMILAMLSGLVFYAVAK